MVTTVELSDLQRGLPKTIVEQVVAGACDRGSRFGRMSPETILGFDHQRFLGPSGHLLSPEQMQEAGVLHDDESWLTKSGIGEYGTTVGQAFDDGQKDFQG